MVRVDGPDGKEYSVQFKRNEEIENIVFACSKIRVEIYEGNFPWVKRTFTGKYKILLADGWKKFGTAIRAGFFVGNKVYLHSSIPVEEKIAIAFHELAHILEHHPEGKDIATEKVATKLAISMISENQDFFKKRGINLGKIIRALKLRLEVYEKCNL